MDKKNKNKFVYIKNFIINFGFMLPFYELIIDDSKESGVDFNSLVEYPAHQKNFIAFNKNEKRYYFNEEKKIVFGVMMAANLPIFRNSPFDHYVVFKPETISQIRTKFHKLGFKDNVNTEHNKKVNDVRMIKSFILTDLKLLPEGFEKQNINIGSWFAAYKIDSPAIWSKIKKGEFNGFSVEGWFEKKELQLKKNK